MTKRKEERQVYFLQNKVDAYRFKAQHLIPAQIELDKVRNYIDSHPDQITYHHILEFVKLSKMRDQLRRIVNGALNLDE